MPQLFSALELLPPDPILGLTQAYNEDPSQQKVNLGVGAYKTASGQPLVLRAVRKAEVLLAEEEADKEYLPITGDAAFVDEALRLHYGDKNPLLAEKSIVGAQCIGGTGALLIAAQLLQRLGHTRLHLPQPTWPNHLAVFKGTGLDCLDYPYYAADSKRIDFKGLLAGIASIPEGEAIVFHACCHNPTGCDLVPEQWDQICALVHKRRLLPLFDMAYQGFGQGIEEDAYALRLFARTVPELVLCSSFAKNFGLYGERVGLLSIRGQSADDCARVISQVKQAIRSLYSNPPKHGAALVRHILSTSALREIWEEELTQMRARIQEMRLGLAEGLSLACPQHDFSFLRSQQGMFSFTGLTGPSVDRLRKEYSIFMTRNGRMNVAGLNPDNLDYVVHAFSQVLGS